MISRHDPAAALLLLSRLPLPRQPRAALERGASAAWCYPAVGAGLAGLAALPGLVAIALGLPAAVAAALALACLVLLTGALHEDGLADSADGLWGGWTPERRLEIMRDSRIGTYGVMALGLVGLLRWSGLTGGIEAGQLVTVMMCAGALSRAGMVAVWAALPPARRDGVSVQAGRPAIGTSVLGLGLALGLSVPMLGVWPAGIAACATASTALIVGALAQRRIGGQTGDILGATQQCGETAALLAILTAL